MKVYVLVFFLLVSSQAHCFSDVNQTSTSSYTKTKYPLVLVHGFNGYTHQAYIVEYWFGIVESLSKDGASVFPVLVSAVQGTEIRGEQLLSSVEKIIAATGAEKVNLIGHSHGALTARYVAGVAPDLVASVTSVAGVNKGSELADFIRSIVKEETILEDFVASIVNVIGGTTSFLSGNGSLTQNAVAAVDSLTTKGVRKFNKRYPYGVNSDCKSSSSLASNGIHYFSWGGKSTVTNILDPSDLGLLISGGIVGGKNDGLVRTCSSHLGKVLGKPYRMNHQDVVNQTMGLRDASEIDPVTLFRQHANRLKSLGL
nr:triacylglycerol lipase [Veronia nyctiphanis]